MQIPGQTTSLWAATDVDPRATPLEIDLATDIVVVGSGIAGLSTAYEFAERGQRVVVLDRGSICKGMTSRTSAHLTPFPDDSNKAMVDRRGVQAAQEFYHSQRGAVDRIEFLQHVLGIPCNFRRLPGLLFPGPDTSDEEVAAEFEAAVRTGIPTELRSGLPFKDMNGVRHIVFERQATFHPLRYLSGIVSAIRDRGGLIYRDSPVAEVIDDGEAVEIKLASGYVVRAAKAVIATNSPINGQAAVHSKQAPYRTYVVAFKIKKGAVPDALYWDMLDPYHYVRIEPLNDKFDTLIVGGEDHKSGAENDGLMRFEKLEVWTRHLIPGVGEKTHQWSGQVMDTLDYSAHIGLNPGDRNVYITTGDSGQGLTHGVVASLLIPALVNGDPPAWADVYAPDRKPISAVKQFFTENATAIASFAERFTGGDLTSVDSLPRGEGALIRDGLSKTAAYRAHDGELVKYSASCSHAGCIVQWNSAENCWDCPCHGSQFSADGAVLNGPATMPLQRPV